MSECQICSSIDVVVH